MRVLLLTSLLMLLLSATHLPTGPDLEARMTLSSYEVWNCDPDGGPSSLPLQVFIANPYYATMSVNFSYYDFPSQSMKPYGRACLIPAHSSEYCTIDLPASLGGEGSGNASTSFLLYGAVEGYRDQPQKTLHLSLIHQPPSTEVNLLAAIAQVQSQIDASQLKLEGNCIGEACCGMQQPRTFLEAASRDLAEARKQIRSCSFSLARNRTDASLLNLRDADRSYLSNTLPCNSSLTLYRDAQANLSGTNKTIASRALCGTDVNGSRSELSTATSLLENSSSSLSADRYSDAQSQIRTASDHLLSAIMASQDCPTAQASPEELSGTTAQLSASPPPLSNDLFSLALRWGGYAVLVVLLFITGIVIYISIANRAVSYPPPSEPTPKLPSTSAPPKPPEEPEGKIDEEFERWLKEQEQKAAKEKKKKK